MEGRARRLIQGILEDSGDGSEHLKQDFLPRVARGDIAFWQGFSEPNAGSALLSLQTTAVRDGDDYVINGRKIWNSHAGISTYGLVIARTNPNAPRHKGLSMFVVANGTPGLAPRPIRSMTGGVYHYEVFLDHVRVQKDYLLGKEDEGFTLLPLEVMSGGKLFEVALPDVPGREDMLLGAAGKGWEFLAPVLQRGALARCAEMVGCAQRILDTCVDYAKGREQSGRPIGAFQAIQHHCADLLRNVEGSRYILYKAAWSMQAGLESTPDVAMAKAHVSDACLRVARQGHQIMGAISYCEEHPLHLFHKRIQAAGLDFGDAGLHLETVAQAIGLV